MENFNSTEEKRIRKKTLFEILTCPICGCTVRENELETHYKNELEKLNKIKKVIKSPQCSPSTSKSKENDTNGTSSSGKLNGDSGENCWGTYQKIKENRVRRNNSKLKNRKRKVEDRACPICFKIITEDLQMHVELCLKRQENNTDESDDDEIDVGETYNWCGQTRIRATTLIEGSLSDIGCLVKSNEPEDELVNIDGDDETFGPSQYTERDIILLNKEDERLRDLVVVGATTSTSSSAERELREENNQNVVNVANKSSSSSPVNFLNKMEVDNEKPAENDANPQMIIESLKAKIKEYENFIKNRPKCLICLTDFEIPVVSVMCWHVYCEKCWLNTLGAKKLCPQCSTITSALDLRRIYL